MAWAPLDRVKQKARWEARIMVFLLVASILLVAGTAAAISRWLAIPLVQMSHGLDLIAQGNLDVEVAEARSDEIGNAGRILDGMTVNLRERRLLTRFVAPQVLEVVTGADLEKSMVGRKRDVAVLASDIRNFTTISESNPPREVFSALNDHLKAMTTAIQAHGGVIDRFIGDAVIAVFYPSTETMPELRAFEAAKEMMDSHKALLRIRQGKALFPYNIGIGIDSGTVLAGAVGDEEIRLDFTVIGGPATKAAQLENLSKKGHASRIVVSEHVRGILPQSARFLPVQGETDVWEFEGKIGEAAEPTPIPTITPAPAPTPTNSYSDRKAFENKDFAISLKDASRQIKPTISDRASRIGTQSSSGIGAAYPILFWCLTFLIVFGTTQLLIGTAQEHEEQEIRQQLFEKAHQAEENFDPETSKWKFSSFQFDPPSAWFGAAGTLVAADMASAGFKMAFLQEERLQGTSYASPEFLQGGALHSSIVRPISGISKSGRWVIFTGDSFSLLNKRVRLLLAKEFVYSDLFSRVSKVPWIFLSGWILAGMIWVSNKSSGKRKTFFHLRGQLTVAFLATLIPILVGRVFNPGTSVQQDGSRSPGRPPDRKIRFRFGPGHCRKTFPRPSCSRRASTQRGGYVRAVVRLQEGSRKLRSDDRYQRSQRTS